MFLSVTFRVVRTDPTQNGAALSATDRAESRPHTITLLTIPSPPSVNALTRNVPGRGRVKTAAYKDWIGHAGWILANQRPAPIMGRVIIVIGIERVSSTADIDNKIKAIFDLLVTHKVIKDDRFVTAFAVSWWPKANGNARVAVMQAGDMMLQFQTSDGGATGGWFIPAPEQEGPANDGD